MTLTTICDLIFAGGVVLAALALAGAGLRRVSASALAIVAALEAAAAIGVWVDKIAEGQASPVEAAEALLRGT